MVANINDDYITCQRLLKLETLDITPEERTRLMRSVIFTSMVECGYNRCGINMPHEYANDEWEYSRLDENFSKLVKVYPTENRELFNTILLRFKYCNPFIGDGDLDEVYEMTKAILSIVGYDITNEHGFNPESYREKMRIKNLKRV